MIPIGKHVRIFFVITVISLLIVGCAPSRENAPDNVRVAEQDENFIATPKSEVETPPTPKTEVEVTTKDSVVEEVIEAETNNNEEEEDVFVADEKDSANNAEDTEFYHVTDAYDPTSPTLMGFTINDTLDQVIDRFGAPLSESIMNDGTEPLQIYEYPGFILGANSSDQIVFIEVNSTEVNPGLNKLHVGHTVEQARKSLGTPDSLNEYVMIFLADHVITKLDIDPNTNIIRSIKLFAE